MIKIAVPEGMSLTTIVHLSRAGYRPVFEDDRRDGRILGSRDTIIKVRSYDIPVEVADGCHAGLVGSDWVEERELELGSQLVDTKVSFKYGREFNPSNPPTLDFITRDDSPIQSLEDIKPGQIILTEYPNITKNELEKYGHEVVTYGESRFIPQEPKLFRDWLKGEEYVGIRVVHGSIAALVNNHSGVLGVMVNETGGTLRRYNMRIVSKLRDIDTLLIVNPFAMARQSKEREIKAFQQKMEEAYSGIMLELEANTPSPEGLMNGFKERGF